MQQLEHETLGRYRLQHRLARGGMAEIYLARDEEADRVVAVKLVHTAAGEYYERFRREVRVLATLSHRHILPVIDYGEYKCWYYLISPYIEYGTLNDRLAKGPLSLSEAYQIFSQLAEALQYAHDQGIVHRDIKPSNVLMKDGSYVYLADFGLVKEEGVDNSLTLTGYLIGTPEYMAPELAEVNASPRSDIYALGVLLYQMLTGQVPFKASTPIGIYLRHIRETPPLPSSLNCEIAPAIEDVVMHALEKDPKRRFQSAHEFCQAFKHAIDLVESGSEEVAERSTSVALCRPRVALVQSRSALLHGRILFMTLLLAFLAALSPVFVGSLFLPLLLNTSTSGMHSAVYADMIVPSPLSAQKSSIGRALYASTSAVRSGPLSNLAAKLQRRLAPRILPSYAQRVQGNGMTTGVKRSSHPAATRCPTVILSHRRRDMP